MKLSSYQLTVINCKTKEFSGEFIILSYEWVNAWRMLENYVWTETFRCRNRLLNFSNSCVNICETITEYWENIPNLIRKCSQLCLQVLERKEPFLLVIYLSIMQKILRIYWIFGHSSHSQGTPKYFRDLLYVEKNIPYDGVLRSCNFWKYKFRKHNFCADIYLRFLYLLFETIPFSTAM